MCRCGGVTRSDLVDLERSVMMIQNAVSSQASRIAEQSEQIRELQEQQSKRCEDQYEYMIVSGRDCDERDEQAHVKTVHTLVEAQSICGDSGHMYYVKVKKQSSSTPACAEEYVYDLIKHEGYLCDGYQHVKTTSDLNEAQEWYRGSNKYFVKRKVTHA